MPKRRHMRRVLHMPLLQREVRPGCRTACHQRQQLRLQSTRPLSQQPRLHQGEGEVSRVWAQRLPLLLLLLLQRCLLLQLYPPRCRQCRPWARLLQQALKGEASAARAWGVCLRRSAAPGTLLGVVGPLLRQSPRVKMRHGQQEKQRSQRSKLRSQRPCRHRLGGAPCKLS